MPFSKLKKLLINRKGWKIFKSKFTRKSTVKNTQISRITRSKPRFWLALSLHTHFKRKKRVVEKSTHHHIHFVQKKPTPVYIDDLFNPVVNKEKYPQEESRKAKMTMTSSTSTSRSTAADDMWESIVLESPLMYDINQRAEEFITKFRAQMNSQESAARRLL